MKSKRYLYSLFAAIALNLLLPVILPGTVGRYAQVFAAVYVPRLSDQRFEQELLDMVEENDGTVTRTQAARNPFLSGRLILKSADRTLNPAEYGAADAIQDREGHYILQFESPEAAKQAAFRLQEEDSTIYVEPDRYVFPAVEQAFERSEGKSVENWGVSAVGADMYAWYLKKLGVTGTVRVAVLDSGIRKTHEIFAGRLSDAGEYDYYSDDADADDEYGHGTQVAGVVVQNTPGFDGIKIVPVRILDAAGGTSFSVCATAIENIAPSVDVMNMSFTMSGSTTISTLSEKNYKDCMYMQECIAQATRSGTVVVISAGNSAGDTSEYAPANITDDVAGGCIIVGNSTKEGKPSSRSNYGASVDISAPGTSITSSYIGTDTKYAVNSGTSFSAPCVAAAAAMLKLRDPSLSPAQIESILEGSVSELNNGSGHNYGTGILDLSRLVPAEYAASYELYLTDKAAADAVITQISQLPQTVTLSSKAAIEAAAAAYEALTEDQKKLVTNYSALQSAQTALQKAVSEAGNGNEQNSGTGNSGNGNTSGTQNSSGKQNSSSGTAAYAASKPKANVTYRVPMRRKQKTRYLKVVGLAGGDKVVSWKSSDTRKVRVSGRSDGTCLIKAGTRTGYAKITATCQSGRKVYFYFRIQKNKVRTKKLQIAKKTVQVSAGRKLKLHISRYPVTAVDKLVYRSNNKKIAKVSKDGVISAVSPGTTTVIVTSGKAKLKVKVVVG